VRRATDIPLQAIERVEFFKRDELTTDLICCEFTAQGQSFFFHEEMRDWSDLISKLEGLDGFRKDWFSQVSQPPFDECRYIAFSRTPRSM
jgi:hypothetical protein